MLLNGRKMREKDLGGRVQYIIRWYEGESGRKARQVHLKA
jgi:hypothetical protein